MDQNQLYILALANVPTMITVLIGILVNNARLTSMEVRLTNLENKFDTRFDLLLSKVVEIDNRLTRIEAQKH